MPGRSPRPGGLSRRVRRAFTERLGYKAAAIFFSIMVWAIAREDETTEELLPVRFAARVDSAVTLEDVPAVRALIVGRGRELLKLRTSLPVVRRSFGAETADSVRLDLRASDVELPGGVDAVVREVHPRSLVLRFRPVDGRRRQASAAGADATIPRAVSAIDSAAIDTLQARLRDSIAIDTAAPANRDSARPPSRRPPSAP